MALLKAGPPKPRRGAAIPLPVDQIRPTGRLSRRERAIFELAVHTRPGFWALGDRLLLTSFARAQARLEELETANPPVKDELITRAIHRMIALSRVLRLSPYARDVKEGAIAHPTEALPGDPSKPVVSNPWWKAA